MQICLFEQDTNIYLQILFFKIKTRRNFQVEENCPQWWTDTGIIFQSVNHTPGKYNETSFYMKNNTNNMNFVERGIPH